MTARCVLVCLAWLVARVAGQSEACYSTGSLVVAVLSSVAVVAALLLLAYLLWKVYWRGRRGKHLVLVTDPEKGGDYAFDNPGFKEGTPIGRTGSKEDNAKQLKWQHLPPLTGLVVGGKPRALDDSFVTQPLMSTVPLRSHDFTGLGFNICGNMRDGIYVKDVLHRGPASESGRITPGDRIESIRISLRHMVFEDALTILSYASPYEVQLEVESGTSGASSRPSTLLRNNKRAGNSPTERICHPFYRSHSISDLLKINKTSPSKWANDSTMGDLSNGDLSKPAIIETSPIEKMQKVGVRVLPPTINSDTLKIEAEKSQNARNSIIESGQVLPSPAKSPSNSLSKLEKSPVISTNKARKSPVSNPTKTNAVSDFDEIDLTDGSQDDKTSHSESNTRKNTPSPGVKETNVKSLLVKGYNNLKEKLHHAGLKMEKEMEIESQPKKSEVSTEEKPNLVSPVEQPASKTMEEVSLKESQDIPEEVQKAGMSARTNRKSIIEDGKSWDRPASDAQKEAERNRKDSVSGDSSNDDATSQKKNKRKAPAPPPIKSEEESNAPKLPSEVDDNDNKDSLSEKHTSMDSVDTDSEQGDKSGTTIELNSSHITVHHAPDTDTSRKAASLGDLSRIGNDQPIIVLERAVSLDLADGTPGGSKKRKAPLPPQEEFSDDTGLMYSKEARMDNTVHSRLKHSSDFGRLEDAVKLNENVSDEETDLRASELSTPDSTMSTLISSTPMKQNFFMPSSPVNSEISTTVNTVVNKSAASPTVNVELGLGGLHVSKCSWDLSVPDSTTTTTTEQFVTAINGNTTEDEDDVPPELPTSPIPTYVTEIQVVTANKDGTPGFLENGQSEMIDRDDVFPKNIPEMSSFMTNNIHRPFSTFTNNPFSVFNKRSEVSVINSNRSDDMNSLPSYTNLSNTLTTDINQVSLSQPNSLDPISQDSSINDLRPTGALVFSNENLCDEQILAMKSSPEPIMIDSSQHKTQVSKPTRSNVSVTSIKAASSRIPVRATPEPSQRKTKKENYISFSSLNVSPANDKRHTNGSGENSITHIVLNSHK